MCLLGDIFDNEYAIIAAEVLFFTLLCIFIIVRLSNNKCLVRDLERIEKFLDKVDDETLIKLCEIDQRSENRKDSIKKNVDQILRSKRFIEANKNNRKVREHMRKIDESFLNIFKASVAIKSRDHLDQNRKNLIDKLDQLIRERDK